MRQSRQCTQDGLNKGAWAKSEDRVLMDYVKVYGEGKWNDVAKKTGLKRCGKSCRLRWKNYLSPAILRGNISKDEEELIIRLHKLLGNRWSLIAGRLPGRTDNEIKNYWNTTLAKRAKDFKLNFFMPNINTVDEGRQITGATDELTYDEGVFVVAAAQLDHHHVSMAPSPETHMGNKLESEFNAKSTLPWSLPKLQHHDILTFMDFNLEDICKYTDDIVHRNDNKDSLNGGVDDHQDRNSPFLKKFAEVYTPCSFLDQNQQSTHVVMGPCPETYMPKNLEFEFNKGSTLPLSLPKLQHHDDNAADFLMDFNVEDICKPF